MSESAQIDNQNTPKRQPTELDQIAERWAATQVELTPELRVYEGLEGDKAEYSDMSPASFDATREATERVLREVREAPIADEVDRVTQAELIRTLELDLEMLDAKWGYREVSNISSFAQDSRMVFDLMSQESEEDFTDIARRMRNLPGAIDQWIQTLRVGIDDNNTAAKRQVREVINQVRDYAKPDGFFNKLATGEAARRAADGSALAGELEQAAAGAADAYGRLGDFLEREYLDAATEEDAFGREAYALQSRHFVGARIDLDETYEWGLEETRRMREEQEAIAREIKPGATVAEAIAFLDQDEAHILRGTDALQKWMQEKSDQAIEELGRTHFDIPAPMRKLECMIAPTEEGAIYYTGPSDDFSRPGRMWWSVTPGVTEFGTWRELTTVYHEGVPGHHLQVARATYVKDQLNTWRRRNWTSGHGEGWALYAERLMEQLGYLDDPADRLGMLDGQRMRAARVALDIGVHLGKEIPEGGKVWDYDYAYNFMRNNVNMPDGFVHFEVNRYFGWGGQAPSYKVGQRIWEQIRDESAKRAGDQFDLKAWHTKALNLGGVGLDTLREAMLRDA